MITLELTIEEARFLREQLSRQLAHIEDELVHTDARDMQRELAQELERLRALTNRLSA